MMTQQKEKTEISTGAEKLENRPAGLLNILLKLDRQKRRTVSLLWWNLKTLLLQGIGIRKILKQWTL
jgi:hypothetical protein